MQHFDLGKRNGKIYAMLSGLEEKYYQAACYDTRAQRRPVSLISTEVQKNDSEMIITEKEKFAKGNINETLERHKFFTRNQEKGEIFKVDK